MLGLATHLTRKRIAYGGAILFIVLSTLFVVVSTREPKQNVFVVVSEDFIQEISVSGRVTPAERVDLVFSQSGRVSGVYVEVGDEVRKGAILAELENGDARADVAQKKAAYDVEIARLDALKSGIRPEKIAVSEAGVANAKLALIDAIRNVHTNADDVLHNRVDQFFYSSRTQNPKLTFILSGQDEIDLEWGRLVMEEMLKRMEVRADALTPENIKDAIVVTAKDIAELRNFLDKAANVVNALQPTSELSQANIDAYRVAVSLGRSNVQAAAQAFTNARSVLETAEKNLVLEKAGNTKEDIAEQEARASAAKADLASTEARYRKTLIIAPFSGIVTVVNAKAGGDASSASAPVSIMSAGALQIESFVPEIHAPIIKAGDEAIVMLDAYGDTNFAAVVVSVDPAETIRDGVSTYRTLLQFKNDDNRARPGMTANVRITTEKKENVLTVPQGVVARREDVMFVRVKENDLFVERLVQTGSVSSLGMMEIISGLERGDTVLLEVAGE